MKRYGCRCFAQDSVIGDGSSAKLIKTRLAKSVYDAGWYLPLGGA